MPALPRFARLALAAALMTATISPASAHAWHEAGHRLVARIAWDDLTPAQQIFVSDLLTHHPRFAADFVARMPADIEALPATDMRRRQWVFVHASIWPDLIKDEVRRLGRQPAGAGDEPDSRARELADATSHDHSTWHYANEPIFADPYALTDPAAPASSKATTVGIQQALPAVLREFSDPDLPAEQRAVALAWLVHLLGDSHQPLHTATLFAARLLPQGDRGGNLIIVTTPDTRADPATLHSVWDGLFNNSTSRDFVGSAEPAQQRSIVAAHPRARLQAELVVPAGSSLEQRIDTWLDESFRLAETSVYDPDLRAAVRAPPAPGSATPWPVALDSQYLKAAKIVATRRVALAGYRLADCIDLAAPRE